MMVKVCGITTEEDLRAAVRAGATAVGFNFYSKSPRYVSPRQAEALATLAPAPILKVGVFVNDTAASIETIAAAVGLDVAQLHGKCETPAGIRVWNAVNVGKNFDTASLEGLPGEAILVDAPAGEEFGGTGRTFDWSRVQGLKYRLILAGGLGPDNVAAAIRQVRPWGVDACSRLEAAPGIKDHGKVREFVAAALGVES
jgi:phosphoribosylanthranilate isomerase